MASINPISGNLGEKNASHLLRRATFGLTRSEVEHFGSLTVDSALNELLLPLTVPTPPVDVKTGAPWLPKPIEDTNSDDWVLINYFKAWFIDLMRTSKANLTEKMVYFYHSHMPVDYNIILNTTAIYYQNALYRYYALGNFKKLFGKMCIDSAMLVYIDNTLNDIDVPNENFAREMLELYSIGKGEQIGPEDYTNYTEADIKQAARVLTGFKHDYDFDTIDSETGLPRGKVTLNAQNQASRHDPLEKVFSAKFQNKVIKPNPAEVQNGYATEAGAIDEVVQMIDMIFAENETARFLCRKLYRFFVYYEITPEIETDIIEPLAATFRSNNYDITPVLRQLFSSEHFYDMDDVATPNDNIGALIKSPIDIIVGAMRYFQMQMPSDPAQLYDIVYNNILRDLDLQGMSFFTPIDVAGYPPYHQEPVYNRNWISPNYLARRYQHANNLVTGIEDGNGNILYKLDAVAFADDTNNISDPKNPRTLVTELTKYMFTNDIPVERYNYFLNSILLDNQAESHWTDEWIAYKGSGDDMGVRGQLEKLIIALMQSPEYQLF